LGLAILSVIRCGGGPAAPSVVQPWRVAAAADLQHVFPSLMDRFIDQSNVQATLTFDVSGGLAEKIKADAPSDVVLCARVARLP
jgi:ABC-type molybdate transport system substrate-binding protein